MDDVDINVKEKPNQLAKRGEEISIEQRTNSSGDILRRSIGKNIISICNTELSTKSKEKFWKLKDYVRADIDNSRGLRIS